MRQQKKERRKKNKSLAKQHQQTSFARTSRSAQSSRRPTRWCRSNDRSTLWSTTRKKWFLVQSVAQQRTRATASTAGPSSPTRVSSWCVPWSHPCRHHHEAAASSRPRLTDPLDFGRRWLAPGPWMLAHHRTGAVRESDQCRSQRQRRSGWEWSAGGGGGRGGSVALSSYA